jgi:hypothetical protein
MCTAFSDERCAFQLLKLWEHNLFNYFLSSNNFYISGTTAQSERTDKEKIKDEQLINTKYYIKDIF